MDRRTMLLSELKDKLCRIIVDSINYMPVVAVSPLETAFLVGGLKSLNRTVSSDGRRTSTEGS